MGKKPRSSSSFFFFLAELAAPGSSSYLRFLHLNDPRGWDNNSSMSPKGAGFLNVMQHEAGHLIVKLKRKNRPINNSRQRAMVWQERTGAHAHTPPHAQTHRHAHVHTQAHTKDACVSSPPNQPQKLRDQISNVFQFANF